MEVYQESFRLQQEIFTMSKKIPTEERYSLTDQIRRSSRSIGANLAESWAKRRYPAHFLSKLTDADGELQETLHWISSAAACAYLSEREAQRLMEHAAAVGRLMEHAAAVGRLMEHAAAVGRLLGSTINNYQSFCSR